MPEFLTEPDQHAGALHPADAPGLVTVAVRDARRWRQLHVHPDQLTDVARLLRGRSDCYLTPNRFTGPRSVARLLHLSTLWADLDYHRLPSLSGLHPWHVRDQALRLLAEAAIPAPGLAIATGRGLCLVWRHQPVPRAALPRWRACQRRITDVLAGLGADPVATDAARVLRLIGTVNGHTGALVEAISPLWPAWPFEELAGELLELGRGELRSLAVARAARSARRGTLPARPPSTILTAGTYWEAVLSDLQRLRLHRWLGPLPSGHRDAWMFLAGVAASWLAPAPVLRRELVVLARECADWDEPEARARLSAVVARSYSAARGERIEWEGRQVDPRYRFRAETILRWLSIEPEEMRAAGLRVLVDVDRRREIAAERERRSANATGRTKATREAYLSAAADRRARARELRGQGLSWGQVGEVLGLNAHAARMLASRGSDSDRTSP